MAGMATSERAVDRGQQQGERIIAELGREIREARLAAGLSQGEVGRAVGLSGARISLVERGRVLGVPFIHLPRILATVGLDLSARAYPAGQPLRDGPHLALLAALRSRISVGMPWRTEVPLPTGGDRRAWDAVIGRRPVAIGVEAETRLRDAQALERRINLKKRDGDMDRVILLLSDTRWNRMVIRTHGEALRLAFPIPGEVALAALSAGRDPGGDAIILLKVPAVTMANAAPTVKA
jgi:transcriptional regulator with XRE-family HTH domain